MNTHRTVLTGIDTHSHLTYYSSRIPISNPRKYRVGDRGRHLGTTQEPHLSQESLGKAASSSNEACDFRVRSFPRATMTQCEIYWQCPLLEQGLRLQERHLERCRWKEEGWRSWVKRKTQEKGQDKTDSSRRRESNWNALISFRWFLLPSLGFASGVKGLECWIKNKGDPCVQLSINFLGDLLGLISHFLSTYISSPGGSEDEMGWGWGVIGRNMYTTLSSGEEYNRWLQANSTRFCLF